MAGAQGIALAQALQAEVDRIEVDSRVDAFTEFTVRLPRHFRGAAAPGSAATGGRS